MLISTVADLTNCARLQQALVLWWQACRLRFCSGGLRGDRNLVGEHTRLACWRWCPHRRGLSHRMLRLAW